ncbi:XK-related protein 6-like [Littorina saxatilis]|uniref:XK-related protein n=1 Tax=Littorina saxatilis TaxID=31220 RepID=A0AAN9AM95_9CAEN
MDCSTPLQAAKPAHPCGNGQQDVSSMAAGAEDCDIEKRDGQTGISVEGSVNNGSTANHNSRPSNTNDDVHQTELTDLRYARDAFSGDKSCTTRTAAAAEQVNTSVEGSVNNGSTNNHNSRPFSKNDDVHQTELADLRYAGDAYSGDQSCTTRTAEVAAEQDNASTSTCNTCMCSCCCGICSEETEPESKRFVFQWYDVPFCLAGAALYAVDIYTDLRLAVQFLLDGDVRYGGVTLSFVMLAYVVSVGYGVKEYVRLKRDKDDTYAAPASVWFVRLLCTLLMLGPIVNTVEYIYNGCKSRRKRCKDREKYMCRMKNHHMNNAFLRLFEACLEAAPQLVFQLYVMVVNRPPIQGMEGVWRILTVVTSWLSLAHTLTAFTKSRRNSSDDDCYRPSTVRHQAFDFLWRLAETGGRVLCIALFASVFQFWLLAVLIPHGLIMACWQFLQERDGSVISLLEYLVYAYVFQFCFINNYSGGYSRIQYLVFYVLFYAESFAMLGLWYWFTPYDGEWFHLWGLVAGLASLPLHVLLQLFYYKCCHPNSQNIKVFVVGDRGTWKQHLIGPFRPRQST